MLEFKSLLAGPISMLGLGIQGAALGIGMLDLLGAIRAARLRLRQTVSIVTKTGKLGISVVSPVIKKIIFVIERAYFSNLISRALQVAAGGFTPTGPPVWMISLPPHASSRMRA